MTPPAKWAVGDTGVLARSSGRYPKGPERWPPPENVFAPMTVTKVGRLYADIVTEWRGRPYAEKVRLVVACPAAMNPRDDVRSIWRTEADFHAAARHQVRRAALFRQLSAIRDGETLTPDDVDTVARILGIVLPE